MPGLALFGIQKEEEDLDEIVLRPEREAGSDCEGEGGGPAHLECTFLLSLSFV